MCLIILSFSFNFGVQTWCFVKTIAVEFTIQVNKKIINFKDITIIFKNYHKYSEYSIPLFPCYNVHCILICTCYLK